MKRFLTLLSCAWGLLLAPAVQAQLTANDSVSLGPGYATDAWYSFSEGVVGTAPATNWDLAFQIEPREAGIRINEIKGVQLYLASTNANDFETADTAGKITPANRLHNSDTTWNYGAFNRIRDARNPFDYGWGLYNQSTQIVNGSKVFFLRLADSSWHKVRGLTLADNAQVFTLEIASLDNSRRDTLTFDRRGFAGKRFGYYSFATGLPLDREPAADRWDLLFTRYFTQVQDEHYPVMGVLANYNSTFFGNSGVRVAQADDVDPLTQERVPTGLPFATPINTIGSDWKEFNMQGGTWNIAQRRVYFVENVARTQVWRLIFTGFGGTANGRSLFFKGLVPTSRAELASLESFTVWPNPTTDVLEVAADSRRPAAAARLTVLSLDGRELIVQSRQTDGPQFADRLDLAPLPAGFYLVKLEIEGAAPAVTRVIKSN